MIKFCIQSGESSREKIAIYSAARHLGYDYISAKECPPDCIPIGDVPFCEAVTQKRIPIIEFNNQFIQAYDFYPDFLKDFRHREIHYGTFGAVEGYTENSLVKRHCLFLKKAKEWKSDFESRVYEWNENVPYDFYYFSKPVEFVQEWRYYIAGGELITTGWYLGSDEDEPAPELNVVWPRNFNAAIDFGRLNDGKIALVESHAPFACGWYGENHEDYVFWQYEAWNNW